MKLLTQTEVFIFYICTYVYLTITSKLLFQGKVSLLNVLYLSLQKFHVFHDKIERNLYKNIKTFLLDWYKEPKSTNLFMLLITCGRTILFIFQEVTYQVGFISAIKYP